jgi:hypothetical protein
MENKQDEQGEEKRKFVSIAVIFSETPSLIMSSIAGRMFERQAPMKQVIAASSFMAFTFQRTAHMPALTTNETTSISSSSISYLISFVASVCFAGL